MKFFFVFIVAIISALLIVGCSQQTSSGTENTAGSSGTQKFVVGYANLDDTDAVSLNKKMALMHYVQTDPNIEIHFVDAEKNINKQLDQIDEFITQKVNAIVILAVDSNEIVPGVKKANAAGIPVIASGIQINGGDVTFIGVPNYDAGKMQGEFMRDRLPLNASILYIQGTNGLQHTVERWQGFKEALLDKRPDVKLLDNLSGNYDRAEGLKLMENWLRIFARFDAVITANDQMALGAVEALKAGNRLSGVMISGVDGTEDALQAIKTGEMVQTILQDADGQSRACFELIQSIAKGEKLPKEVMVPFKPITNDNLSEYLE